MFAEIAKVKPTKLLVIADGPRPDRPGEAEKCAAARTIIDGVDWECEVLTNYSDVNLGCEHRVSSGLNWVFDTVEEAIILEDDCLPNIDFFKFCENLLAQYREDERIMMICGTNFLRDWKSDIQSYHFSFYGGIWGWASWRRAWKYYDVEMKLWGNKEIRDRIRDVLADEKQFQDREKMFWRTYRKENVNSWDYQWSFARLYQSGLSIVPAVNLISNIGFGQDATHTLDSTSALSELNTDELSLPLKNPVAVAVDRDYDNKFYKKFVGQKAKDFWVTKWLFNWVVLK